MLSHLKSSPQDVIHDYVPHECISKPYPQHQSTSEYPSRAQQSITLLPASGHLTRLTTQYSSPPHLCPVQDTSPAMPFISYITPPTAVQTRAPNDHTQQHQPTQSSIPSHITDMHSLPLLTLALNLLIPLTTAQDPSPAELECAPGNTPLCCPSLASNATGPCGTAGSPAANVTDCTQEKYPQGWACCVETVRYSIRACADVRSEKLIKSRIRRMRSRRDGAVFLLSL